MAKSLYPVPCPRCDEAQNVLPGGFDPDQAPFGPVTCMVCGHTFSSEEYRQGLADIAAKREAARVGASNVVPLRRN